MLKGDQIVFGPLELPSGMKIKFREPKGADRVNVIQMLKLSMDTIASGTLLIDAYVAAKCITDIDGKAPDPDYKKTYDKMIQTDADFYVAVFQEMFSMNDDKREKAKAAARFLQHQPTCTDGSK